MEAARDRMNNSANKVNRCKSENKSNELLKAQDEQIKQLHQMLKAYQKKSVEQNKKLTCHDSWYVDFNSWNKNYTDLEAELSQLKVENLRLNEIIQSKNSIINEFQRLIEVSSAKFKIYDDTNTSLKIQNEELKRKLQVLPTWNESNEQLKQSISEHDGKIEGWKFEFSKKEELWQWKIASWDKNNKNTLKYYDEEVREHRVKIETLKLENENNKRVISELKEAMKKNESEWLRKLKDKEKEAERLGKTILKLQSNMQENDARSREKINSHDQYNEELATQVNSWKNEIITKNENLRQLNIVLEEYDKTVKESEQELRSREYLIRQITEEKERLLLQLNNKQVDFVEFTKSSQQEIDILHKKLLLIDTERNQLLNYSSSNGDEIKALKEQINLYESSTKSNWCQCQEVDHKYNELVKAFEMKEEESIVQAKKFNEIMEKRTKEVDAIRWKYDKKVKTLQQNNNELRSKCNSWTTILVSWKDYALNMESIGNYNNTNANLNNSYYSAVPIGGSYGDKEFNNWKDSKQWLRGIKEIISSIDNNILEG